MRIKLTNKAERGIGLRSTSTGKLTRYAAGDVLEVSDNVAIGIVNSGLAVEVEASNNDADDTEQELQETPEGDAEQNADDDAEEDAGQESQETPEGDAEQNADDDAEEDAGQESQETPEGDAEQNADDDAKEDAEQESDSDYEAMTKEEIVAICKEKGIATKSRDTKEELIAKLTEEK